MKLKALILVFLTLGSILGWATTQTVFWSRVYEGVTVAGIPVGGVNKEEIKEALRAKLIQEHRQKLTLYYGDTRYYVDATSLDVNIDIERTAEDVWNYGRTGTILERLEAIYIAKRQGHSIPVQVSYNEKKLDELIDDWRTKIDRPSKNASISVLTGGIIPQEAGRELKVSELRPQIIEALRSGAVVSLPLPVKPLEPQITITDLDRIGIKEMLATYTTVFDIKEANRTANIKLASAKINGQIIYPGQTFSFNETVGPRDKVHGFKEALEIVDGEFVPGIGGGVCQVSSTLYNAVVLANFTPTERYNHSKPLGYVPLGLDATVAYGTLDFKFSNVTLNPIMLMAEVEKNKLIVGILGQVKLEEKIEIITIDKQVIPPGIIKKQDEELYLGETKMDKQGKPGFEVTIVRSIIKNGQETKKEILSKDKYLPDNTIVKVGTKIPPFVVDVR